MANSHVLYPSFLGKKTWIAESNYWIESDWWIRMFGPKQGLKYFSKVRFPELSKLIKGWKRTPQRPTIWTSRVVVCRSVLLREHHLEGPWLRTLFIRGKGVRVSKTTLPLLYERIVLNFDGQTYLFYGWYQHIRNQTIWFKTCMLSIFLLIFLVFYRY